MNPHMRVIDYIKETAQILNTDEGQLTAKQMCERFLFDSSLQYTPIERLSGGEKRRLYLLKVLMEAPNVLLLDEPTNDLDITTLQILEDYLDHFQGIIITVSHDRYFLDRICDGLFVFNNHQITYQIGGYSQYIQMDHQVTKEKNNTAKQYPKKQRKNKLTYMEKKELVELEDKIPNLEKQILDIEEKMNDVIEFSMIQELTNQRDELTQQLELLSERWMELIEKEE